MSSKVGFNRGIIASHTSRLPYLSGVPLKAAAADSPGRGLKPNPADRMRWSVLSLTARRNLCTCHSRLLGHAYALKQGKMQGKMQKPCSNLELSGSGVP
jgi:hypothetical protein